MGGRALRRKSSFYIGAPEFLLDHDDADTRALVSECADAGSRVLVLSHCDGERQGEQQPDALTLLAIISLEDTVRSDAPEILEFFRSQGVTIKVISGNNPSTVAAVARRAGVPDSDSATDAAASPTSRPKRGPSPTSSTEQLCSAGSPRTRSGRW